MKQYRWFSTLMLAVFAFGIVGLASAASVEPELVDPWQSGNAQFECNQAGCEGEFSFKIDSPSNGDYDAGGGNTITISNYDDKNFDWESEGLVYCVIVVRGNIANVYRYPGGEYSDTNLTGPGDFEISHITFCFDAPTETFDDLTVTKEAAGTYVRTVTWDLKKYVNAVPTKLAEYTRDAGESVTVNWLLFVTKEDVLSAFEVSGTITVGNPNDFDVDFTISDVLSDGTVATVKCPTLTAPANGTVVCTYTANPLDATATVDMINTVTIGWFDTVEEEDTSAVFDRPFTFTERRLIGVDSGTLTDDRFEDYSVPVTGDFSDILPETFTCSSDPADYTNGTYTETFDNTAYLNDVIDLDDDAAVELTCTLKALEVEKDAEGSYDRTVEWTLVKSVAPDFHSGGPDQSFESTWTVVATKTQELDNYKVEGTITIDNPASIAQTFTVTDMLNDGTVAEVTSPSLTVAAGGRVICKYEAFPDDDSATVNTATVTAPGNPPVIAIDDDFDFEETLIGRDSGTLSDPRFEGEPWFFGPIVIDDTTTVTFVETFYCDPADSELYDEVTGFYTFTEENTAFLNEFINLEAEAEVTIECQLRFDGETAWAADAEGVERYTRRGNWATYVTYDGSDKPLYAGQSILVGTVYFSELDDVVTITVELDGDWIVDPDDMTLAVQDYEEAPSGNPAPGLFDHKTTCSVTSCMIDVPKNNFYGIHVNVGYWY